MPDFTKLRLLIWQRMRARFTSRRRSLGMQIHHEKRRLIKVGVSSVFLSALMIELDTRPKCSRCGKRVG